MSQDVSVTVVHVQDAGVTVVQEEGVYPVGGTQAGVQVVVPGPGTVPWVHHPARWSAAPLSALLAGMVTSRRDSSGLREVL